jgi:hypothetical protein
MVSAQVLGPQAREIVHDVSADAIDTLRSKPPLLGVYLGIFRKKKGEV